MRRRYLKVAHFRRVDMKFVSKEPGRHIIWPNKLHYQANDKTVTNDRIPF